MNRTSKLLSKAFIGLARAPSPVRVTPVARTFQQSLQMAGANLSAGGAFGSRCFSNADPLSGILARELAEEIDAGRDNLPEELLELKNTIEKDWKIVDDGATTRLFRTVGAAKVVITFHCQDTVDGLDIDYTEGVEEEPAVPFRFEIVVSKAGHNLVLNCVSSAGETTVDGAATSTEDLEDIQANGIGRNQYQGPEFPELAEDLQEAFQDFVFSDLAVDEDVSAFISMYADYKEQISYVDFLENVSKVLP